MLAWSGDQQIHLKLSFKTISIATFFVNKSIRFGCNYFVQRQLWFVFPYLSKIIIIINSNLNDSHYKIISITFDHHSYSSFNRQFNAILTVIIDIKAINKIVHWKFIFHGNQHIKDTFPASEKYLIVYYQC